MQKLTTLICCLCFGFNSFSQDQAILLGTWNDSSLPGSFAHSNIYNEIWGLAINGKEYGIIGTTAGTHFIDVTDPNNPFEAHFVAGKQQGGSIIHRDYHDFNGYLYAVSDEGFSSLQIIDIRCLPDTVIVAYDSDVLIKKAHNIFIDESSELLYAFATKDGTNSGHAMRIYSLVNPIVPTFVAEHKVFGNTTVGHVHDGYVENNLAFLNCGYEDGMIVVDFTDPVNPITKFTLDTYPHQGYNHSGWPSTDLQYYYMGDENYAKDVKVVDISDLEDVKVETTFNANDEDPNSITHNQIVACNYLYISYYGDGLQVYDISDPSDPVKVLSYDTYLPANELGKYRGAWGVYPFLPSGNILVSDMQTGLYVFEAIDVSCEGRQVSNEITGGCEFNVVSSTHQGLTEKTVQVYPSLVQAGNSINLALQSSNKKDASLNISLLDVKGSIIKNWVKLSASHQTLEIPDDVHKGMYFIKINDGQQILTKPIIVQ